MSVDMMHCTEEDNLLNAEKELALPTPHVSSESATPQLAEKPGKFIVIFHIWLFAHVLCV